MSGTDAAAAARDRRLMGLALALGRRNLGRTWPNPAVGAVVVDPGSGRILAQGATAPGGRPHAEPLALAAAGAAARGATLYVSLEPCSHHGRSPPCADAIVAAGVARVVTGLEDANPLVAGQGHARLRSAGIAVETGILAETVARDHRGHLTRIRLGRPALGLKLACTADGFAAPPAGEPRLLITSDEANARTHLMRSRADAILVGIGTARADDPRLNVRLPGLEGCSPIRIVADRMLGVPLGSHLVRTAAERATWLLCGPDASTEAERRLVDQGLVVLRVAAGQGGRLDLREAMTVLATRGLTRILCEGGPELADGLAAADLVDELTLIRSPRPLGRPGLRAIGPRLQGRLGATLHLLDSEPAGSDLVTRYERDVPCSPVS